ncbi:cobalamin biosynthesis protein [Sulfitobacter sp. LCG007]
MERDAVIVAGFGYRGGATCESLRSALEKAGGDCRPHLLATLDSKARLLERLASVLSLPLAAVTPEDIAGRPTLTCSAASLSAHGTGSVAEAVALAAAGANARLLAPRVVSEDRMATCALAEGEDP